MICSKCLEDKISSDFSPSKKRKSGYAYYCKRCMCLYTKKPEAIARAKARASLPEAKLKKRIYLQRPEVRITRAIKMKEYGHLRKFNLAAKDYQKLVEDQSACCAICKKPEIGQALAIDHDHLTGKIRGLLCACCNIGMGNFEDSPFLLSSAKGYLERLERKYAI